MKFIAGNTSYERNCWDKLPDIAKQQECSVTLRGKINNKIRPIYITFIPAGGGSSKDDGLKANLKISIDWHDPFMLYPSEDKPYLSYKEETFIKLANTLFKVSQYGMKDVGESKMSILGNLLTRAFESSNSLVHEIEKKVNKCKVKAHTIQDKDGVIKVNCNSNDDAEKVCNSLREKYNCKVMGRVVTISRTNESQSSELESINQTMEDIWEEFQEQTLHLNFINMSKVKFDKEDKYQYEIIIPYDAIEGNPGVVAKKAQELVDRFYKPTGDENYTIEVDNDEDNEAVRIGVWR